MNIINGMEPKLFWAAMFFAVLGFLLHKLVALLRRDRSSQRTPGKYSAIFWIKDNWAEGVFHLILMFLGVLFTPYILDKVQGSEFTPEQLNKLLDNAPTMLIYTGVGWVSAMPLQWFKKKFARVFKK